MASQWPIALLFLLTVGLLIASYVKLRRQSSLIRRQSSEIEKQIRELIDQNGYSEQLIREKKQLILLVSHDLKGPFNRLFALVQLLEMESANLTAEQREYLGKMYQIVGDGLNMVRNLLDVRKLEERGADPNPDHLNVAAVIDAIVNQYRVQASKKTITIHLDAPAALEFTTDRNFLSRIMENLLSNAIKFSPTDKNVFVTLRLADEQNIEVSVRDEGPGISPEDQSMLYNKFQKLTSKPTGGESSTGLGLSLVKQLVASMAGDIKCTSVVNDGTTFRVRLPMLVLKKTAEAHAEPAAAKTTTGMPGASPS